MTNHNRCLPTVGSSIPLLLTCILASEWAAAGSLLDYLRNYDLNEYAIGIAVTGEQSPYAGSKSSAYAYPYLTSFRDSAFTDDWFLIRDGDLGVRWLSESGWELGAVGRMQTLDLGDQDSDDLLGIADHKWTLEVGPTIGWRGWPVHIYFKTYAEVSDRHEGLISQLDVSLPMEWSRGYLVPSVELIHQNSDYVDYYYAVTAAEATPTRPAYSAASSATNLAFKARWGYALSEKWLLSGALGLEQLDSSITDSPIVARDDIWSARIGLAYNSNVFQPRIYDNSAPTVPKVEIRISAFQDQISTRVARDTADGVPGIETDIEEILGAADEDTVLQVNATVRLGHYHRLEFGYFELGRTSTTTLASDLTLGDEVFVAGTSINSKVDTRIFHATYGYSLIRDAQKELGVTIGVHVADFEANISAAATGQSERSSVSTPLPVIGVHASIFLNEKTTIGAKVQIFRTDFDRYEGSLNYATFDVQYRISDSVNVGVGYNFYGMKLSAKSSDINGYLEVRHHGPTVFFAAGF